jgi:acetyltransferase
LPPELLVDTVEHCVSAKIERIIIATSNFLNKSSAKKISKIIRENKIRIMGPNSIGVVNSENKLGTAITRIKDLKCGNVSFFGQTGMTITGFLNWINSQNFGLSKGAAIGNKFDVNEIDLLEYLKEDKKTEVIGMYLEDVKDGQKFLKVAKEITKRKPIIAIKSGRTEEGKKAVLSHTSSLSGEDEIFEGVFRQCRIIRCKEFDELFNLVKGFSYLKKLKGNRICVISITGAGVVLAVDEIVFHNLKLATLSNSTIQNIKKLYPTWEKNVKNPLDIWTAIEKNGMEVAYGKITEEVLKDRNVDGVLLIFTPVMGLNFDIKKTFFPIKKKFPEKFLFASILGGEKNYLEKYFNSLESLKIPGYFTVKDAVNVISKMYLWSKNSVF